MHGQQNIYIYICVCVCVCVCVYVCVSYGSLDIQLLLINFPIRMLSL